MAHLRRLVPLEPAGSGVPGRVDAVLISHLHFDHFDVPTLRMFDRDVTLVVPHGGAVNLLRRRGFTDVRCLPVLGGLMAIHRARRSG